MKVPLLLYTGNKTIHIVKNSQLVETDFPFNPYIIYPDLTGNTTYKLIPTGELVKTTTREYTDTIEADIASNQLTRSKASHHYLRFNEQLFIDQEDYILQHPNTDNLKLLCFDIEVMSYGDGLFPRASNNPITAIGCKFNDEDIKIFDNYQDNSLQDKLLIDEFLDYIQLKDPDIIVSYNGRSFDIPYIVERCKILQLDYNKLARFKSNIFNKKNEIVIKNRIHFDIYEHVQRDQTIMGIKSFKMKDIAIWKKIPNVIELEDHELKNMYKLWKEDKPKIIRYLTSDVNITYELSKGYLANAINLAEFVKVPLDNVINGYNSFIPKIICGRHLNKLGYVALDRNHERYNLETGKYFKTGFTYEGAIVSIDKKGYFDKVWKIDFTGQYPSSIITWNLGPDTTKIHEMRDYTGEFLVKRQGDILWLSIPDTNFNKQIIISIDQSKDGFLRDYIKKLFKIRKELKIQEKEARTNNNLQLAEQLYSQQWAIKVTQNCFHPDTEILTTNGIKNIKNIQIGETVYSININTGLLEKKKVIKTFIEEFDGELCNIYSDTFHFKVTNDHKMIRKSLYKRTKHILKLPEFIEAKNFIGRNHIIPLHKVTKPIYCDKIYLTDFIDISNYRFFLRYPKQDFRNIKKILIKNDIKILLSQDKRKGKNAPEILSDIDKNIIDKLYELGYKVSIKHKRNLRCNFQDIVINNDIFSKFVGYYLSEGSIQQSKVKKIGKTKRGLTKNINISQYKNVNYKIYQDIKDCMFSIGEKIRKYQKVISFSSDAIYELIEKHLGIKYEKFISDDLFNIINKEITFKALYDGDGNKTSRRYNVSIKYPKLFNSVFKLLLELGYGPKYSIDCDTYRISWNIKDWWYKHKNKKEKEYYKGKLYNLTVEDNHTVYAGIGGKFSWIGQCIYGLQGLEFSNYGDMGTAIAIVGCCRWLTQYVTSLLQDIVIERDTDGLYLTESINSEDLNNKISLEIKNKFNIESFMKVELEEFGRGFFYRMKNYLIEDKGKILFHGVSFKSSRHPGLYDQALQKLAKYTLDNKGVMDEEYLNKLRDLSEYKLEDFILRGKIKKEPKSYDNPNAVQGILMDQVKYSLKKEPQIGDQIEYYVTINPAPVPDVLKKLMIKKTKGSNYTITQLINDKKDLDMAYYSEEIEKVIKLFKGETIDESESEDI